MEGERSASPRGDYEWWEVKNDASSLVLRFGRAGQGSQETERLLDLDRNCRRGGQMRSVRLVTVLVGDVTRVHGLSVRAHVRHGSLDHGHGGAVGTGLLVAHLFLFDAVFGLEAEKKNEGGRFDHLLLDWQTGVRQTERSSSIFDRMRPTLVRGNAPRTEIASPNGGNADTGFLHATVSRCFGEKK